MLAILRFDVAESETGFAATAREGLVALAERPGYVRGELTRAYDDPTVWCLITEWASVGAYRRALSAYDVKVRATPLLARALPEASAFEPLVRVDPGGAITVETSDRAASSAGVDGPGRDGPIRSRP